MNTRYELTNEVPGTGGKLTYCIDRITFRRLLMKKQALPLHRQELRIYQYLIHPAFPVIYDAFEEGAYGFLLLEIIEGQTLEAYLQTGNIISESEIQSIALSICDIILFLHSLEPLILHLDIKPSNFVITKQNTVYLLDPGSALECWADERQSSISQRLNSVGTKGYAPPELQKRDENSHPDERSDVYSLGKTMRRMMVGYRKHCDEAPSKRKVTDRYSRALLVIVRRATQQNPSLRFQRVEELKEALLILDKRENRTLQEKQSKKQSIFFDKRKMIFFITVIFMSVLLLFGRGKPVKEAKQPEQSVSVTFSGKRFVILCRNIYEEWTEKQMMQSLLSFSADFSLPDENLDEILWEAEEWIGTSLRRGSLSIEKGIQYYHALLHLYLLREEAVSEQARIRIPEIARTAILLIHQEAVEGETERNLLLEEEAYFLECLIVRLSNSEREEDRLLIQSYEERLLEIDEQIGGTP